MKQGMSAEQLALTITLGISFGIIPMIGANTILLTLLAVVFRLNLPAIQLVNYAVYILQLILFIPFFKLGQFFFFQHDLNYQLDQIINNFQNDYLTTLKDLWQLNLSALLVWAIISVPLGFVIYHLSLFLLKKEKLKWNIIKHED
jgi:uncharacterized protein (DUF2062 family)